MRMTNGDLSISSKVISANTVEPVAWHTQKNNTMGFQLLDVTYSSKLWNFKQDSVRPCKDSFMCTLERKIANREDSYHSSPLPNSRT